MESDFGGPIGYGVGPSVNSLEKMKMARTPNLQQRLDMAVAQAEERLAAVKEAREIFQRNPDLEKLLNVMQRGLF